MPTWEDEQVRKERTIADPYEEHIKLVTPQSPSTTSTSTAYSPYLKTGSRGDEVTKIQQQLSAAGFDPGPIDGIFGPKTDAAVKAFQSQYAPPVDGIVGPITRAALDAHGTAPSTTTAAVASGADDPSTTVQFLFNDEYTVEEIQSSLTEMYASAPDMVKERAAHIKTIVQNSKERMRKTYVQHKDNQWG